MSTASSDGSPAYAGSAGDEIVVPEHVAAFLVRRRSAEIIEVIDVAEPTGKAPPDA